MTATHAQQIPATMRAFAIDRFGESGSIRDLLLPEIGPDEMLIRVHAAGINPLDLKIRSGAKPVSAAHFPYVLGQDAAGVVERVGPNCLRFAAGQEVYGAFWFSGSFAQYVRASIRSAVAHKPANASFVQAAGIPIPAMAARAAVEALDLKQGETVLIVGATGSVGNYAVQMAVRCGARVIAKQPARIKKPTFVGLGRLKYSTTPRGTWLLPSRRYTPRESMLSSMWLVIVPLCRTWRKSSAREGAWPPRSTAPMWRC